MCERVGKGERARKTKEVHIGTMVCARLPLLDSGDLEEDGDAAVLFEDRARELDVDIDDDEAEDKGIMDEPIVEIEGKVTLLC